MTFQTRPDRPCHAPLEHRARSRSQAATAILLLLFLTPPAQAAIPLDPVGFTASVAATLNADPLPEPASIAGPLTLKLRTANGTAEISLDNIHHACLVDTAHCPASVQRFVSVISTQLLAKPTAITPESLRIVIRPEAYARNLPPGSQIPSIRRGLPPGLVALVFADASTTAHGVSPAALQSLHLSVEQAFARATANTAKELKPVAEVLTPVAPGKVGGHQGGYYESSRLVMHAEWASLAREYGGHLLVAVPSADELVYANGSAPEALVRLSGLARQRFEKAQRPLSSAVFEWRPEGSVLATP